MRTGTNRLRYFGIAAAIGCFLVARPFAVDAQTVEEVIHSLNGLSPTERQAKLIEGAKKEGEVAFYSASTISETREQLSLFQQRYPFLEPKSFHAAGFRMVSKVLNEARAGRHEVDLIRILGNLGYEFIKPGLIARYQSPERQGVREEFQDRDGFWTAAYDIRVALAYNTELVKKSDAPKSYLDLLDPKWKGKVCIDNQDQDVLSAFIDAWGKEKAFNFFRGLAKNKVGIRRSRTLQAQLVAAGEFHIGAFLHGNRPAEMKRQGAPVEVVMFDPYIAKVSTLQLPKRAPHPHAAILLYDFLISEEVQKIVAEKFGRGSVRKGQRGKFPELDQDHYQVVNPDTAGPRVRELREFFEKVFGIAS